MFALMELNEHSQENAPENGVQKPNEPGTAAEQSREQTGTGENEQRPPQPEPPLSASTGGQTQFKPITARVRENTEPFFRRVAEIEVLKNFSTADAFECAIYDLLGDQKRARELGLEISALRAEVLSLKAENERLLKLTENEPAPKLADNEFLLAVDNKLMKLLRKISENRFNNPEVAARYKLEFKETIGELLLNCIRTQEILFDYNCCFYTGLTRQHLEDHQEGRDNS